MLYIKIKAHIVRRPIVIYRQIVNADALSDVISIPQIFKNKRVEVIIGNLRKPPPRRRTVFFSPDVVGRTR
jgi:hypothetical protein